MDQFLNDLYVLITNFAKEYILYLIVITFVVVYYFNYKFTNKSKVKLDSEVMNMEDSLISLHDDNSKRIDKLEKQVKSLETLLHDKELEIKKLERTVDSLK
jgi:amino acid permease